jgi:hypothetical protein
MVNETMKLTRYRQAIFFRVTEFGRLHVQAASGADRPKADAPFNLYLKSVLTPTVKNHAEPISIQLSVDDVAKEHQAGWHEWGLGHALWCPLTSSKGGLEGGLFLAREEKWEDTEKILLELLVDAYAHAWNAIQGRTQPIVSRLRMAVAKRRNRLIVLLIAIALLCLPVRLSVLAPVEIRPKSPVIVSAPMDGVIKAIPVQPNQLIKTGRILFRLDDTTVRNEYEVAKEALSVTKAEYIKATQKGFADEESRSEVLLLKARMEMKTAQVQYAEEVLERSRVKADKDGIVVFTDTHDWIGKPVVVGEKVMSIADPTRVEAEIMLPVADAINLEPGARVKVFLNTEPDRPIPGELIRAGYEAEITVTDELAFRLKAALAVEKNLPRIGLRGTAKVYGERVTLFYYLMRKPLTVLRLWLGV